MDGYSKVDDIHALFDKQLKINKEINDIADELDGLPDMPNDLEGWTVSISDTEKREFKLSDFIKMSDISKKYTKLVEEKEINSSKLKVMLIDSVLDKIKEVLD